MHTLKEIESMEAGREMDALVTTTVMQDSVLPWHERHACGTAGCFRCLTVCPHYSTDIADAWEVVEKLTCTTRQWFRYNQSSTTYSAIFQNDAYNGCDAEAEADTAPLAICRAALMAVSQEGK